MTESTQLSAESRINIKDVPEQISRIFFGQGNNRPSYTDDGYGSPGFLFPSDSSLLFYRGYQDDIFLLVKLGQAALIIFMIFATIAILLMATLCCTSLVNITNKKRREDQDERKPPGTLSRTAGVTNLSLETETDSSTTEEIQVRVTPGPRRRERDETDERQDRLSSSTSSSSQLSHARSLPYYEVPTVTRPGPGFTGGYRMRTFGSPATSPPPLPNV